MKKMLLVTLLALTFAADAMAHETPAARNCRVNGGQPWALDVGLVDDLQLCVLGQAKISAQALFEAMTMGQTSEAVNAYASSPIQCGEVRGTLRVRTDTEGRGHLICGFSDGSAIGQATLLAGKSAPQNAALTRLLGL